jgi:FkbM family methyltransferase
MLPPLLLESAKRLYRATPSRALRQLYFRLFLRLVNGRKTVTTVEGMTFELDLSEMIDVGVYLQQYERDVVTLIERFCRPGWCVLDIGANIGAHTLRFAKIAGSAGTVYAFEPTDYAYGKLIRNISLNAFTNISPFQVALSDSTLKHQTVDFRSSWRSDGQRVTRSSVVDFECLDDWCDRHHVERVDLVKLDVDGNEFSIVNGARRLLERSRPIFLAEVGAWHFEDAAQNPFEILRRLNYRFWSTKPLVEYASLSAIRQQLPWHDDQMTVSLNVLAAPQLPESSPT